MPSQLARRLISRTYEDIRAYVISAGLAKVLPVAGAVVTGLLGWLGHIPAMFVWLGIIGSFSIISFGWFFSHQLVFQRTAEWKLAPIQPQITFGLKEGAAHPHIREVRLGMSLQNNGIFPIEYKIVRIQSIVDGHIDPSTTTPPRVGEIIYPGVPAGFLAKAVMIDIPERKQIDCVLRATIEYGRPGGRSYEMRKGYKMAVMADPESPIAQVEWTHLDDPF